MRNAELDDDISLAAEVEDALKSLGIASAGKDDSRLRLAVDHLRKTSHRVAFPTIMASGRRAMTLAEGRHTTL